MCDIVLSNCKDKKNKTNNKFNNIAKLLPLIYVILQENCYLCASWWIARRSQFRKLPTLSRPYYDFQGLCTTLVYKSSFGNFHRIIIHVSPCLVSCNLDKSWPELLCFGLVWLQVCKDKYMYPSPFYSYN